MEIRCVAVIGAEQWVLELHKFVLKRLENEPV